MADDRLSYLSAFIGGAAAGLMVDASLYPLDTLKTRMQSEQGLMKAGGFKGVYRGIGPLMIGSAPQTAVFFCSYETLKDQLEPMMPSSYHPLIHMSAASISEVVACIIRVPFEIVKQRQQTSKEQAFKILFKAYRNEGFRGLYRGFGSTAFRDVPFAFIQFPVLEYLKLVYKSSLQLKRELHSWEVAGCGSLSGGVAAALTTPLDVVKTRIMLADKSQIIYKDIKISTMVGVIYSTHGIKGLFAGFVPRVLWISLGGCIFFGTYDLCKTNSAHYLRKHQYS